MANEDDDLKYLSYTLPEDIQRKLARGGVDVQETFGGGRELSEDDTKIGWGDLGRGFASGSAGVASSYAGAAEYATAGNIGTDTRKFFDSLSDDQLEKASYQFRRAARAAIFPSNGEESIFDVGVTDAIIAKGVTTLPSLVAAFIPASIAVKALSFASVGTRAAVGAAAAKGSASVLNMGDMATQIYKEVDKLSDEELAKKSSGFNGYLLMGMDPREARRRFRADVAGVAPIAAAAITYATGGLEGMIGSRLGGESAKGFLKGFGKGFLAEGLQEVAENGGNEMMAQEALSRNNLGEKDWLKVLNSAVEGFALGGLMGGPIGGLSNIDLKGKPRKPVSTGDKDIDAAIPGGIPDPLGKSVDLGTEFETFDEEFQRKKKSFEEYKSGLDPAQEQALTSAAVPPLSREEIMDFTGERSGFETWPGNTPYVPGIETDLGFTFNQPPPQPRRNVAEDVPFDMGPPVKNVDPDIFPGDIGKDTGPGPLFSAPVRQAPAASTPPSRGGDTGQNLPERPADLKAQREQLMQRRRVAMLYPVGTPEGQLPKGMKRVTTDAGVFHYNPEKIDETTVKYVSAKGQENLILGLGPFSKEDILKRAAQTGEQLVSVTETTQDGATPRAAIGTTGTASTQMEAMKKDADPNNTIQTENLEDPLTRRLTGEAASTKPVAPKGDLLTTAPAKPVKRPKIKDVPAKLQDAAYKYLDAKTKGEELKAEGAFRQALPLDEANAIIAKLRAKKDRTQKKAAKPKLKKVQDNEAVQQAIRDHNAAVERGDDEAAAEARKIISRELPLAEAKIVIDRLFAGKVEVDKKSVPADPEQQLREAVIAASDEYTAARARGDIEAMEEAKEKIAELLPPATAKILFGRLDRVVQTDVQTNEQAERNRAAQKNTGEIEATKKPLTEKERQEALEAAKKEQNEDRRRGFNTSATAVSTSDANAEEILASSQKETKLGDAAAAAKMDKAKTLAGKVKRTRGSELSTEEQQANVAEQNKGRKLQQVRNRVTKQNTDNKSQNEQKRAKKAQDLQDARVTREVTRLTKEYEKAGLDVKPKAIEALARKNVANKERAKKSKKVGTGQLDISRVLSAKSQIDDLTNSQRVVSEEEDVTFDRFEDRDFADIDITINPNEERALEILDGLTGAVDRAVIEEFLQGEVNLLEYVTDVMNAPWRPENERKLAEQATMALVGDKLVSKFIDKFEQDFRDILKRRAEEARARPELVQKMRRAINAMRSGETNLFSSFQNEGLSELRAVDMRENAPGVARPPGLLTELIHLSNEIFSQTSNFTRSYGMAARLPLPRYETGRPVVADVFHGAQRWFENFSRAFLGTTTEAYSAKKAFFFARNPATSNEYANINGAPVDPFTQKEAEEFLRRAYMPKEEGYTYMPTDAESAVFDRHMNELFKKDTGLDSKFFLLQNELVDRKEMVFNPQTDEYVQGRELTQAEWDDRIKQAARILMAASWNTADNPQPNLRMSRILMENPLVVDVKGSHYREGLFGQKIDEAIEKGHDGVVFVNTFDGGPMDVVYAVIYEDQISDRFNPARKEDMIFPHSNMVGDPPSQEANDLERDLTGRSLTEALEHLMQYGDKTENEHKVASRILDMIRRLQGAGVKFDFVIHNRGDKGHPRELDTNARGMNFVSKEDLRTTVYVNGSSMTGLVGMSGETILHEASHAALAVATKLGQLATQYPALAAKYPEFKHLYQEVELIRGAFVRHFNAQVAKTRMLASPYTLSPIEKYILRSNAGNDVDEMLAWALTNKDFREYLRGIPYGPKPEQNLWQRLWRAVTEFFGFTPEQGTALYAILEQADRALNLDAQRIVDAAVEIGFGAPLKAAQQTGPVTPDNVTQRVGANLLSSVSEKTTEAVREASMNWSDKGRKMVARFMSNDQLRQVAEKVGPEFGEAFFKVTDALERMGVKGRKYMERGHEIGERLYKLRRQDPKLFQDFADLTMDATTNDIHPNASLDDNVHEYMFKKDGTIRPKYIQAAARHREISAKYRAIVQANPEYARVYDDATRYFAETQNAITRANIEGALIDAESTIKLPEGKSISDLADWIFNGGLDIPIIGDRGDIPASMVTQAEAYRDALGDKLVNHLSNIMSLKKIKGAYFPLMRRGDFVIQGFEKFDPMGGRYDKEESAVYFDNEEDAKRFAASTDIKVVDIKEVAVGADGKRTYTDPEGKTKYYSLADMDTEPVFEVKVQNKYVEFFDNAAAAKAAHAKALASGDFEELSGVQNRRDQKVDLSLIPRQVEILVNSIRQREGLDDAQRKVLVDSIIQSAITLMPGSRVQHRRKPRRYVAGASDDLVQNTLDYSTSAGNYLAKQELGRDITNGMKALREAHDALKYSADDRTLERDNLLAEIENRIVSDPVAQDQKTSVAVRLLLTLSFLDKLASPAYSLINAMQPWMVTMPVLAGKYGFMNAQRELLQAYRDIGGVDTVRLGVQDTIRMWSEDKGTDFLASYKERLEKRYPGSKGKELSALLDYLSERGAIDANAGLEIARLNEINNAAGRGLNRAELIMRAMPTAIEAMNRATTAIAEYNLSRAAGLSEEAAMKAALTQVNNTQGNYSATNAAPIFNHPLARVALQFKKYGQMMYHLLGQNVYNAYKGASPEEKAQARKTLFNLAVVHTAFAGMLGLPLEPIKILLLPIGLLGGPDYDDLEDAVRQAAAKYLGNRGGEILTKGLPRGLGFDLSSRVGLDSLLTFGSPRDNTERDLKVWLADTFIGAPGGLVVDWGKGIGDLMHGDFNKGFEKLIPIKIVADSLKAYREGTEGKVSKAGRQTMEPTNAAEMGLRVFGLSPASVIRRGESDRVFYRTQKEGTSQRTEMMGAWLNASKAERGRKWDEIRKWNEGKSEAQRITLEDLKRADKRRETENARGQIKDGYRVTKRDEEAYARSSIYR